MRISAFTQIIVTVAVTAWVFILPVKAVATILVFELALLLSIKRDRMTMAAIGGLAVFTGLMILFQLLFGSPLEVALTGGLRMLVMTMAFLCMLAATRIQDIAQTRFRQDIQVFTLHVQPLGPQLQLMGGFLAGNIQNLRKFPQLLANLQHQCGLADTRRAAHQHQGALHRAAAQHPVQLPHAGRKPDLVSGTDIHDGYRLYRSGRRRLSSGLHRLIRLLHDTVPCAAGRAASGPLGGLVAALGAVKNGLCFHAFAPSV